MSIFVTPFRQVVFAAGILAIAASPVAHAQCALYAEHENMFRLVMRVEGSVPYVDNGAGKLVPAAGRKLTLSPAKEWAPMYVAIRNQIVRTSHTEVMNEGAQINHRLELQADFESAFALDQVFMVIDLYTDAGEHFYVTRQIGDLQPREPKSIGISAPIGIPLGAGKYRIHLFTQGSELFHSAMPFGEVEGALDNLVRRQVVDVENALPEPYLGPAPDIPAGLRKSRVAAQAIIHFTVSPTGRVLNPTIKSATHPEFGETALAAARLWRFLPRVKEGVPVAAAVDMPFVFNPPKDPKSSR
ncbi:energy transducer TonB [Opitutus sp. ER46]|uniref:energy transducer TonB n=1 Tax=Opitutus sp. ER46 TaxID=2161864 RepID=UPI000D2F8C3C|nr:energy transducer TonB [Opitutus sp. ER46]PTX91350.1 hypothetical protein DB354_15750 [Opitutus sp. ER46]